MWNEDYKEMLECFLAEDVDFVIVGAYALAAHGFPRATLDIDIWVRPSPENAVKVYTALAKFGAPTRDICTKVFESTDTIFQIGVPPRRIDILTSISGVLYDDARMESVKSEIGGIPIRIISIDHLIQNKLTSGRGKDLDDVAILRKLRNK